jgi:hypothetical protein
MVASQLWLPGIVHSGLKHEVFIILRAEGSHYDPKHSQPSFWVHWTRTDASQLWYPKVVHFGSNTSLHLLREYCVQSSRTKASKLWFPVVQSGLNTSFASFTVHKVSEVK